MAQAEHPDRAFIEALRRALTARRDPDKAAKMQAYMKSEMPFLGVQKPQRVEAWGGLMRTHLMRDAATWRATALTLFREAEHREEWYAVLELLGCSRYRKWLDLDALPMCEALIVEGAWWDIVDDMAANKLGMVLRRAREEVTPIMRRWAVDPCMWRRRSSIIVQLKHRADTDTTLLGFAIEQSVDSKEFFLRKAIGWALREYAKTAPAWVEAFVASHPQMSNLSRREALRNLWKQGQALSLKPPARNQGPSGVV